MFEVVENYMPLKILMPLVIHISNFIIRHGKKTSKTHLRLNHVDSGKKSRKNSD